MKSEFRLSQTFVGRYVTEATIIAAGSAYSYLITFFYEQAYLAYFGVPNEFVDLGLERVVYTFSVLLLIFGAAFQMFGPIVRWLQHPRAGQILVYFLPESMLTFVGMVLYFATGANWLSVGFLFVSFLMILLCVLLIVAAWQDTGSGWAAFEEGLEAFRRGAASDLTGGLMKKFGKDMIFFAVILLIALPQLAKGLGDGFAARQRDFVTVRNDYHLLAMRGSDGIFVKVLNGKSTGDILLLNFSTASEIPLIRREYPSGVVGIKPDRRKPTFNEFWTDSVMAIFVSKPRMAH